MRTAIAIVILAGCEYHPPDPGTDDAAPGVDAADIDGAVGAIDAMPPSVDGAWCRAETDPTTDTNVGRVGGPGGTQVAHVLCNAVTDVIIGVAIEMSDGTTLFNGRSARGFRISCAPVTLIASGPPVLGTESTREVRGDGAQGWSPSTWSAITRCPAGSAMSGLEVHTGTGSSDRRFIDATIQCAELGADGAPTGLTTDLYVEGSLDESAGLERQTCGSTGVVRRLSPFTGSGLDSLGLYCAQTRCAP